jgi:putative addiction module component (TIGR02574 family)
MSIVAIRESMMQLPASEKVALIDLLWDSLGPEELTQREQRWAAESEERVDAVERGELTILEGPEAIRSLRQSLRWFL